MNEVVSPAYTLTVYGVAENLLTEKPIRHLIEQLLKYAHFSSKGTYMFKVQKFHSHHPVPTLEFEHTGKDSVYLYHCRIGNVVGLTGVFQAVLKIPEEAFHGGITDELNRAATKLLAELANAPTKIVDNVQMPEAVPVTPTPSIPPAQVAPPAPPPPKKVARPVRKTKKQRPKKTVRRTTLPAAPRMDSTDLKKRLHALKRLVAEEVKKKQSELAALNELARDLERMEAEHVRQAAALALLKKLS